MIAALPKGKYMFQRLSAPQIHLTRSFLLVLAQTLAWTAMIIYQVQVVGMSPLQLVLAGTVFEITIFFCEIPTGIIADLYSRRLSVILGYFLTGASYLLQGLVPRFEAALVGAVIWGVGVTLISGAYDAWLADEVGEERLGDLLLHGAQVTRVAALFGIVSSGFLGSFDLRLPIVLGGVVYLLISLYLALLMPETAFHPTPRSERTTAGKMLATFREGLAVVRERPALGSFLAVALFFGLFSEAWDRLWQAQMLLTFNLESLTPWSPIVVLSGLRVVELVLTLGVAEVLRRRLATQSQSGLLVAIFWLTLSMVLALFVYGLAPQIALAFVAFLVFSMARELVSPLLTTWVNQQIKRPHVRATVLSMSGQMDAIGQMTGGPPLGAIGTYSLRLAFVASGLLLSPVLYFLQRARQAIEERAKEERAATPSA